ncbi:hypothetical protein AY599_05865 [Leptolyngbya valderiana BDU 20041]|nr:hypothetical protein AY599_05865 [Leptolyngbya valderiana BDU 20041]
MQRYDLGVLALALGLTTTAVSFGQAQPDAAAILRSMAEYHGSVQQAEFACTIELQMVGTGAESRYWVYYEGTVAKPGRLVLRHAGAMPTASLYAGPDQTIVHGVEHNSYVTGDGVEDVLEAFTQHDATWIDWQWRMLVGPGLKTIVANDPMALLEDTLETAEFIGVDEIDNQPANHVRIEGGGVAFDMWIAAQGEPRLLKAQYPLPQSWIDAGWLPESQGYSTVFTSWATPDTIADERLAFTPPDDAREAKTIAGAFFGADYDDMGDFDMEGWDEPQTASLVGTKAPAFELATTGGGTMSLEDALANNKVVVLDFWATWCPPCREGLPVLDKVATKYAEQGVTIYAVNVQESEEVAAQFMEQQKLSLPVALDADGAVSEAYQVSGIPQTVVIDADGTIRAVHVGFSPSLAEDISAEIEASIAGEPVPEPYERRGAEALPEAENMSQAWAVRGTWNSVTVDRGDLLAAGFSGVARMTPDGGMKDRITNRSLGSTVRTMRLAGGERGYVVFTTWGEPPTLLDESGAVQWSVPRGQGPNDAWPADLDGDGIDELIVGYNGNTGIRAYDAAGEQIWSNQNSGNIWHVTALDLDMDGTVEAISTSAGGTVHVYDGRTGRQSRLLWSGDYANLVRPAFRNGEPIVLLGTGGFQGEAVIIAVDARGKEIWRRGVAGEGPAGDIVAAASRSWAAAVFHGGLVCVLDLEDGRIIAHTEAGGNRPGIAWHETEAGPVLLVANGQELKALAIDEPSTK